MIIRLVAEGLLFFFQIYSIVVLARIILSWFMFGGVRTNQTVAAIYHLVYGLTEPLLAPIRKLIPPIKMGMAYLDLSPFILLVLISLARQLVFRYIYF
jgi:YggT family protein